MTIYEGITMTIIIIGLVFIIYSHLLNRSGDEQEKILDLEDFEEYQSRIEEINQKILELNEYSEFTKSELEIKHKELLFLYQLISEKTKELENISIGTTTHLDNCLDVNLMSENAQKNTMSAYGSDNNNKQIIDLNGKGYNPAEIAKMLDIGQGQVKLVLDLYK